MDSQTIKDKIDLYQQIYFTHDEPIPFKGDLFIYPVLVKDYYQFYSLIDIFTVEKNEDKSGIGIAMTNLDYLIHMTKSDFPDHEIVIRKIISMFELIFHIKNGLICECDENYDTFMTFEELFKEFSDREKKLKKENPDIDTQVLMMELFNIRKCPKCGKDREDIIRYKEVSESKQTLMVGDVEITDDDFDLLRKVVCYQNMPDYDDEYIDPELKAELELAARLENPNNIQPTLEKQETCLIASTAYTYETIKQLSIRHLVMLLRSVDAKLHYFTYRQAEASGMVQFKGELAHWIYSNDKKSKLDKVQSFDSLKDKLSGVAKM